MPTIIDATRYPRYSRSIAYLAALAVGGLLSTTALPSAAVACGGEVPTSCDSEADDAR